MHVFYNLQHALSNSHIGTWYVPDVSGSCPPLCSGFSFDMIDVREALLFGGKTIKGSVLNDVFLLSLDKWVSVLHV